MTFLSGLSVLSDIYHDIFFWPIYLSDIYHDISGKVSKIRERFFVFSKDEKVVS